MVLVKEPGRGDLIACPARGQNKKIDPIVPLGANHFRFFASGYFLCLPKENRNKRKGPTAETPQYPKAGLSLVHAPSYINDYINHLAVGSRHPWTSARCNCINNHSLFTQEGWLAELRASRGP